jgi:2-amino-4-hydroxy-6-hydroxymethyldihydropteridine diphosphokinase
MTIYLLTGTNLGNRMANLEQAKQSISEEIGTVIGSSSIYESEPWGFTSEHLFLNQVIVAESELNPQEVLVKIGKIETLMGRIRTGKGYSERVIDIDILFYGQDVINLPGLIIPHQHLQDRMFALLPMNEISPDFPHPVLSKTISRLMAECKDKLMVHKIVK